MNSNVIHIKKFNRLGYRIIYIWYLFCNMYVMHFWDVPFPSNFLAPLIAWNPNGITRRQTKIDSNTDDCFERWTPCFFKRLNRIMLVFPSLGNGRRQNDMLLEYITNTAKLWRSLVKAKNENGVNWWRSWLIVTALLRPETQISIHFKTLIWNGLLTPVPILTKLISGAVILCPLLNNSLVASSYFPLYPWTPKCS